MASETDPKIHVHDPDKPRLGTALFKRLKQVVLRRVWYIHTPVVMIVQATPAAIRSMLKTAARPSVQRLEHRNLFASGRRYYFQAWAEGFRMTTTHSRRWRYRQRTTAIAVMNGTLDEVENQVTRITLHSRISPRFLVDALWLPLGMTALLIYVPWPPWIIAMSILTLFALSWVGHRTNVVLEAEEMVWFTQKALEDLVPAEIRTLGSEADNVVYDDQDFEEAWEKFYREHRDE